MASLTRYNSFNEVVSLRDAMDRLFEDSFISRGAGSLNTRGAAANLFETAEGFILQVPMPGTSSEEVEITAQQDTLTLKWETSSLFRRARLFTGMVSRGVNSSRRIHFLLRSIQSVLRPIILMVC